VLLAPERPIIESGHHVALRDANLHKAKLSEANLSRASLKGAHLKEADLQGATLVDSNLTDADLTGCRIYGVSAWRLKLEGAKQRNLIITPKNEPEITVDNIEVAQFIYLLLHNEKIRDVIDTIGKKGVLLLGRFTDERKAILDALREELRKHDYLPILFDFDVPATRDITETVSLLARMARFIIADMTDPSSIPKELEAIVPYLAVPVQPLCSKVRLGLMRCSRTIGNTTGYFHRTDTRDWGAPSTRGARERGDSFFALNM
jgi:Pentapeptide repeats (8 copies)